MHLRILFVRNEIKKILIFKGRVRNKSIPFKQAVTLFSLDLIPSNKLFYYPMSSRYRSRRWLSYNRKASVENLYV